MHMVLKWQLVIIICLCMGCILHLNTCMVCVQLCLKTSVLLTAHSMLFTVPSMVSSMDATYITMFPGSPMQLHYCYHNHALIYSTISLRVWSRVEPSMLIFLPILFCTSCQCSLLFLPLIPIIPFIISKIRLKNTHTSVPYSMFVKLKH